MSGAVPVEPGPAPGPLARVLHPIEDALAGVALALMVALPLTEIALRRLAGTGIPGSIPFVQHLVLWVGFLGAALAAREGTMLALATGTFLPPGRWRVMAVTLATTVAAAVSMMLCVGAYELVLSEREAGTVIAAGFTTWAAQTVLPFAFALIALRTVSSLRTPWPSRAIAACGLAAGAWLVWTPGVLPEGLLWPLALLLLVAAACGTPIFVVLGGLALVLFLADGVGPSAVLIETYQLAVKPTLASIPLFTLCGFLLAEGKAPERLLNVFRAWFGWFPGGTAVVCAMLSAFFTVFTGGSGVTILALGGLLLPALIKDGYREKFSIGLLTASGSLGLLLPPSLPLILYAIVAQIPVEDLFIGGILPGILLLGLTAAWGVREGVRYGTGRTPFSLAAAKRALWDGKWEVALPVVVLVALFGGFATIVEAAALAALYAFVVQVFVHHDVADFATLRRVFAECVATVGGVLVILGVAVGLTSYLIGADVPGRLLEWTQNYISSPLVFLLLLNLFLLVVGCLMDIYSATFVVVPLIVPLGQAFGIHPVHLGIIFVANLELGYLTPPVGMNLFLSSYRFKKPLLEVAAATLPMLGILLVGVLLITYVPWMTTALLGLFGKM